jgi:hypothetical protein
MLRTGAGVLTGTVLLVVLWVSTLTTVNGVELVAATGCALVCVAVGLATRRALGIAQRPRWAWLRWLPHLPGAVVGDLGRLAVGIVRARRDGTPLGTPRTLTLPDEHHARADARRALGTIAIGATPGSYVAENEEGTFVLHALSDEPTALERAVRR